MNPNELQRILEEHKAYLRGAPNGRRANLYGANLSNADLSYANLSNANLYGANLSNADLSYANLSNANLSNADLGPIKKRVARMLFFIGACSEALNWIEASRFSSLETLTKNCARNDWLVWLKERLGGKPSTERLEHVINYVTAGRFDSFKFKGDE